MKKLIPIYAVVSLIMCYLLEAYLWGTWNIYEIPSAVTKGAVFIYVYMLIYVTLLFCTIDYAVKKQKEAEKQSEKEKGDD